MARCNANAFMSSSDADLIDFYFPLLRQTSRRAVNGANICNCLPNMHYWLQKLPKHDIINLSINFPFFNTRRHKNQDPKILTSFRMLGKIYIFDCRVMARIGIVFNFFFFPGCDTLANTFCTNILTI